MVDHKPVKPLSNFIAGHPKKLLLFWVYLVVSVLDINFFLLVASTCYLVLNVVAKFTYLVATIGGHVTAQCQIYDQTKFHMVKGIANAFDHMELCFVFKTEELFQ